MRMSKRTALPGSMIYGAIFTFTLGTWCLGLAMEISRPLNKLHSWDMLIFSQTWPQTSCYLWESKNSNHACNFPKQKDLWTIHGLWPTKFGTMNAGFCNKSVIFDHLSLYEIKQKLHEYWIDIELQKNETEINISKNLISHKNKNIWFHEWEKYGSCVMTLPALNSEFKYFNQGIKWFEKYNMKDVLEKGGIKVNNTTSLVTDYWKAIKSVIKANAWIECVLKSDTKQQMLSEIRICFDKSLKIINCNYIIFDEGAKTLNDHSLTNCDLKKPILYLDNVLKHNSSINSNSIVDKHQKMQFRSKRKVVDHLNEQTTKSPRNLNRSNSFQPRTNTTHYNNNLNRSNSFPFIERYKNKDWDLLIFSQSWPYTFCHTLTINSKTHTCNLPANRNQWTIHGIWPSKPSTSGPAFCNNQTSFSLDALRTIIPELKNRWTEIKGSKFTSSKMHEGGLWRYEWMKHGTCARSSPALNTELKYFKQALDWSKQYPLSNILARDNIKPNGTYPVSKFWNTLKSGLGKTPRIDCFIERNSNKVYIDEIRICFNKALSLVDCDVIRRFKDKPYTNCPLDKEIHYLGVIL